MTKLLTTQLPIAEGDQRHLADFIQGQDIPLGLHPKHENFKQVEGGTSAKDYNCLVEGYGMLFTNKELAHSHIWVAHFHTVLFCPWAGLDGCCPHPDPFQNWEAFQKYLGNIYSAGIDTSCRCEHSGVK